MATLAPVTRVPFAPLDNPRLQHLASAKNRQSGILAQKLSSSGNGKAASVKRPFESSSFDFDTEGADSENIDPALLLSPSKKSKSGGDDNAFSKPLKPFTFSLHTTTSAAAAKSMPPPPPSARILSTTPSHSTISSPPRAPMTAPAGRSPKRKASTFQSKTRRISAPFSRIDPPFGSASSGLPFSLDAALHGTFSSSSCSTTPPNKVDKTSGATIQESMPKTWFFDIYEDTPQEEAANLMEHSTLTLDLSSDSDDEGSGGVRAKERDRGKENTPPEDYDVPTTASSSSSSAARQSAVGNVAVTKPVGKGKKDFVRQKVQKDDMDDGARSPLCDLETEPFIPDGLTAESHVIVDGASSCTSSSSSEQKSSVRPTLFATPVVTTDVAEKTPGGREASQRRHHHHHHHHHHHLDNLPVVTADGDVKGEIIVWEDSPSSASGSGSPSLGFGMPKEAKVAAMVNENPVDAEDGENASPDVVA